ncbi:MAG: YfiR family protein [Terriglobia bacterium]
MDPHRALPVLCALIGAAACATGPSAKASAPTEYDVKAAYLYNFAQFVQWPGRMPINGNFSICVLGMDPFGRSLDKAVAGQTVDRRRVIAKRIETAKDTAGCRILFISSSEAGSLKDVLAELGEESILTVSDIPQFVERGGMIDFVLQDNRVRFEVNLAAAKRAGLTLSSQLLKVAARVEPAAPARS